jgi:hypothetical protein
MGACAGKARKEVLFGPVYDVSTPEWKKFAFLGFFLIAALVLHVARSRPQHRFLFSVLLALIAVLFVLVIYVFR